ncbi:hypothetical protein EP7_004168 [Isosphaeraceae bacterium EP7]
MKIPRKLPLALGLMLTLDAFDSSTAQAQSRPSPAPKVEARDRGRTGRGRNEGEEQARTLQGIPLGAGAGALLTRPEVRDELDLKDAQKQSIDRAISDLSRRRRRGSEGRSAQNEGESNVTTDEEAEASLTKSLDAKQKQRLNQLVLRNAGARALLRPDVINRLKMTEEQVMQIHEVFGETGEQRLNNEQQEFLQQQVQNETPVFVNEDGSIEATAIPGPVGVQRTPAQAIAQARTWDDQSAAAQMQAAGQILRKNQRQSFDALLGAPFDMSRLRKPYDKNEAQKDSADKAKAETKPADPAAAGDATKKAAPTTKPTRKSLRDRRKAS